MLMPSYGDVRPLALLSLQTKREPALRVHAVSCVLHVRDEHATVVVAGCQATWELCDSGNVNVVAFDGKGYVPIVWKCISHVTDEPVVCVRCVKMRCVKMQRRAPTENCDCARLRRQQERGTWH